MDLILEVRDEELLIWIRLGRSEAQEVLFQRYFAAHAFHVERSAPGITKLLGTWEINNVFFETFLHSIETFGFGRSCFRNYFEKCLRHDLFRALNDRDLVARDECVSLDGPLNGTDEMTLHDVLPSQSAEDPKSWIDYLEEAYRLRSAPKRLTEPVLAVARLRCQDWTFREIAARLGISERAAKGRYLTYKGLVERIIHHGDVKRFYGHKRCSAKNKQ